MLAPPADLTDAVVADALGQGWALSAARIAYLPVGWGSHHWAVVDDGGTPWFATIDDLGGRRDHRETDVEPAYHRLRASVATAVALRDAGRDFVVAPVPTLGGEPLIRVRDYGVSVYPFIDGESFEWGQWSDPVREALLDMVTSVHSAPSEVRRHARRDDFAIPHRGSLLESFVDAGPYSRPMAVLLDAHRDAIHRVLAHYDGLVALADLDRMVLTHGEPHPGNAMRTAGGWKLIDWDTVLIAPPERDLWHLEPLPFAAVPEMLELYRIRWLLADIAYDVNRFRRPHSTGPDEDKSWRLLQSHLSTLPTPSR
jgi:hypothetical protein